MSKLKDMYGDTITIETVEATALVTFTTSLDYAIMQLEAPALREFIQRLATALAAIEGPGPDRTHP